MKLRHLLSIQAGEIGTTSRKVLHKKMGKSRGLSDIEKELRNIARENARSVGGKISKKDMNDFIEKRRGYLKKTFSKLNNPKTDVSISRANLVDDTESKTAKYFGEHAGYKSQGKTIYKIWVDNDGCDVCSANANQGPIPIDDTFDSGDDYPLVHPECQCDIEYVTDLDE